MNKKRSGSKPLLDIFWDSWVILLFTKFQGLFNFVAGFVAEVIVLYFQIPKAWRQVPAFFKIICWLVATQLFLIVVFLLYFGLGFGFYIIPRDYQWTLALIIPFIDGFSTKILCKLAVKEYHQNILWLTLTRTVADISKPVQE